MDHLNNNTNKGKGRHLNYEKRLKTEALSKSGPKSEATWKIIGCSGRAVGRELSKGRVTLPNSDITTREEYSAQMGEKMHGFAGTGKGPMPKIGNDYALVEYIEEKIIKEKMSPYAVAELIKANRERFRTTISTDTIYNYIDEGIFPNLTNKHLPVKNKAKKRSYDNVRTSTNNRKGTSISERPKEIDERKEYGHWEMDTVVGKKKTKSVLSVLTERQKGREIIRKTASKSEYCVVKESDKLERKTGSKVFRETFKTITCDNGCENLDFEGMERSVPTKSAGQRFIMPTLTARGSEAQMKMPTSSFVGSFPREPTSANSLMRELR